MKSEKEAEPDERLPRFVNYLCTSHFVPMSTPHPIGKGIAERACVEPNKLV